MHNLSIINFSFYNLVLYFIMYSFLGWCVEVAYAYKNQKKFVNRGFLHGPLCPIYGTCILSIVITLDYFRNNLMVLLLFATILTSFIEYFTGFLLEKLFKRKYWDYSEDPFNIHGRICLHFSLMWGLVSVAVVRIIHPIIVYLVDLLPPRLGLFIFYILIISIILDLSSTIASLIDFKKLTFNIQLDAGILSNKYSNLLQSSKDRHLSKNIEDKLLELKEKLINWRNKI
ncbi:putative ABC transporter permease [Clostridium paraputrificum]|uniref:putative ABC transporter permease n=1 Tax=Clostridium TaxID=1485 RepID=UPI003D33F81B